MKKTFLLLSFIGVCFVTFSQKQICVEAGSGSGDGSATNPYRTLQAAVNAATNGDIIKVAKGTYPGGVSIEQKKVQLLGGYAGGGNFSTANPQTNVTIINGTNAAPCIYVFINTEISGTLIINGFTIRNGQRGIKLDGDGSGNLNNVTIENNIIENNGALLDEWGGPQRGGGISVEGNNVKMLNNIIRNNNSGRGAAIGATDELKNFQISNNSIENNKGNSDHGGGVFVNGTGTVTGNIFDGNVIQHPENYGWGGAIIIFADDVTTTSVTLSHNVYRNNSAPTHGGAVFVDDNAVVQMEHELIYNNKAGEKGSAIYVDADWKKNPSTLNMKNCTISGNTTNDGDVAMYVQGSIATVENCIFWNNGKDFELDRDGVSRANLTVTYTLTQQGYTGTGNITSNPLFANAANGDFHLQSINGRYNPATGQWVNDSANSPAIDAGNPSSEFSNEPQPNGSRVNMGCYGNTAEASKSPGTGNKVITQKEWTMYPNPAKESLTFSHLPVGSSVIITDLTGRKVYSTIIMNEQTTISTGNFENGIYIIQTINNGIVTGKKLIVNK